MFQAIGICDCDIHIGPRGVPAVSASGGKYAQGPGRALAEFSPEAAEGEVHCGLS